MEKSILNETEYQSEEIIQDMKGAILRWYPFEENAQILCIESQEHSISEMLKLKGHCVVVMDWKQLENSTQRNKVKYRFNYSIAIGEIERCEQPSLYLSYLKDVTRADGILILGTENRLGLRYFCGDKDPFTNRSFDGIEGYSHAGEAMWSPQKGKMYAMYEIERFLREAGWNWSAYYSVLPGLTGAQLLFDQDYLPKEDLGIRFQPSYHSPDLVFLEEEQLYNSLIQNQMFHQMANAYLFECGREHNNFSRANQISLSTDRGPERALATILWKNGIVQKKPLYEQGIETIQNLSNHCEELRNRGIATLPGEIRDGVFEMPYVQAELGNVRLRRLLQENVSQFLCELDAFIELARNSSEIEVHDMDGEQVACFKKGYIDLVPLNSFYIDNQYCIFDQEFVIEGLPVNALITRIIDVIYTEDKRLMQLYPMEKLWEKYGLDKTIDKWREYNWQFMSVLLNKRKLNVFHEQTKTDATIIHSNRQRLNYTQDEYRKLFIDIFAECERREVYVFGSGAYGKRFITLYKDRVNIAGVLDNNEGRIGQMIEGIPVMSPENLQDKDPRSYKIIICIKNYAAIVEQIKPWNCAYSIYDVNMEYTCVATRAVQQVKITDYSKPYGVGYIAGVFDLFHIGHLNLLRKAKAQCEYLIVGVVSDEGVRKNKHTEPFIPFKERVEIVKACQYVDEAVEIPMQYCGSRDAYHRFHFDVQFSGSDYENDMYWLGEREYLRKHGAELIFFPYTESTSSSKIKGLINDRLSDME